MPKNHSFSKSCRQVTKTQKICTKHARIYHSRERGGTYAGQGHWGQQRARPERRDKSEGKKPIGDLKREGGNMGKSQGI